MAQHFNMNAKIQSESNSNFLTPKFLIHWIWVLEWFHMGLLGSYGVQFIQLKILPSKRGFFIMGNITKGLTPPIFSCKIKSNNMWRLQHILQLGQLCEGPTSQLFLEWLREIFRLKGKIPYVHAMDLYVNLLLDHFYALCISSSCIAIVFLGAKFPTTAQNQKIHVTYSLFPGKLSAKFWNFWKIWKLFVTFGLRKKRKVWDIILQILKCCWTCFT